MQKRNLDFSPLKFKKQRKFQDNDLLFSFFVSYNGFVICQPYTIDIYIYIYTFILYVNIYTIYIYIYIYITCM